ncbi:MAG: hypothetical protein AAAB19_23555 [Rhizobium sp.]
MPNQNASNDSGKSGQSSKSSDVKSTKKAADTKASSSTRGGTHEQHVKAGEQSHKSSK